MNIHELIYLVVSRRLQFLLAAEVTRRIKHRRLHREGDGSVPQQPVPLLPATEGGWSAPCPRPTTLSSVQIPSHSLSQTYLSNYDLQSRPKTRSRRPAASDVIAQTLRQRIELIIVR